jgi:hypothetical protein
MWTLPRGHTHIKQFDPDASDLREPGADAGRFWCGVGCLSRAMVQADGWLADFV